VPVGLSDGNFGWGFRGTGADRVLGVAREGESSGRMLRTTPQSPSGGRKRSYFFGQATCGVDGTLAEVEVHPRMMLSDPDAAAAARMSALRNRDAAVAKERKVAPPRIRITKEMALPRFFPTSRSLISCSSSSSAPYSANLDVKKEDVLPKPRFRIVETGSLKAIAETRDMCEQIGLKGKGESTARFSKEMKARMFLKECMDPMKKRKRPALDSTWDTGHTNAWDREELLKAQQLTILARQKRRRQRLLHLDMSDSASSDSRTVNMDDDSKENVAPKGSDDDDWHADLYRRLNAY